jgi:hypothetical protein
LYVLVVEIVTVLNPLEGHPAVPTVQDSVVDVSVVRVEEAKESME